MILEAATRLRADEAPRAKKRTAGQIKALPTFSTSSAEKAFRVTDIAYIDNQAGLGETPNNRSILYMGFIAKLALETFISVVEPAGNRKARGDKIAELMKKGYGIGSPCLYLEIDSYFAEDDKGRAELPRIRGHEGRARATALMEYFDVSEFPMQCFLSGYRARRITDHEAFRQYLNNGIEDENGKVVKNLFKTPLIFG